MDQGKTFGKDFGSVPPARANGLDRPGFRFQICDMGRADSIKEAVELYRATYGSELDILANVAGVMDAFASADTVTDDVWERCININVKGPTLLTREILPLMKNRGQGSIINVAIATNIIQSVPGGFDGIEKAAHTASASVFSFPQM
ncbi:hypothetical protein H9Q73_011203 [Fusarium xylarioides]|nr:hypothetical protein H9Q73_011203 [Fusarium xylarioides]